MQNIKQGVRSTKQKKNLAPVNTITGEVLTKPLRKHNGIYVRAEEVKETMYTDQTGAFPVRSRSGNRYIMIMCEMDSNSILSKAMKDRTSDEMIQAYQALLKKLQLAGLQPKKHVLDNEMSNEFKEAVRLNGMTYELVPKG